MLCRFAYLLARRFLDVLSSSFRSRLAKEAEIPVLRDQLEVLPGHPGAWAPMKVDQFGPLRRGAGPSPARLRTRRTVLAETRMPSEPVLARWLQPPALGRSVSGVRARGRAVNRAPSAGSA